jgi:hypothetical protein
LCVRAAASAEHASRERAAWLEFMR